MPELLSMVRRLRAGAETCDDDFDRIFPAWARRLSDIHWTPVEVARRAAELLAVDSDTRVLDIGSGVGKFCLIGALTTGATFVGIEQRENLIDVARQTALHYDIVRAQFRLGNMMDLDWSEFDGFYLFNPYQENIFDFVTPISGAIQLSAQLYQQYVVATYAGLLSARIGTRVATYHGFGGVVPDEYQLIARDAVGTGCLEVWEKRA